MSWLIYGMQEPSDRVSRQVEAEGSLGVAIFRVGSHPASGEGETFSLRVFERDQGLQDRVGRPPRRARRARDSDDPLGTIQARVTGSRLRDLSFEPELQEPRGASSDPSITLVLLVAGDPSPSPGRERVWLEGLPPGRSWTVPIPAAAQEDDQDPYLEFGVLGPDQTWDDHPPLRLRKHPGPRLTFLPEPEDTSPDSEWDRVSGLTPEENRGTTLHGRTLVFGQDRIARVPIDADRYFQILRYGGNRALQYGGENAYGCLRAATQGLIAEYEGSDRCRELLVRGFELLGEGRASALNTYDSKIVTLGTGFAGDRLNGVMRYLEGETRDALAEVLDELPGFAGLQNDLTRRYRGAGWSDEARALRLAVPVFARYVQLVEHRRHCLPWAKANLREWVEGSGVGEGTEDVAALNAQLANSEGPHLRGLVTMAAYLRHGRNALTPNPPADLLLALQRGATPSAQLAILFKLHAEACWRRDASQGWKTRQTKIVLERGFGKKIEHFETGYNADRPDPPATAPWTFDFDEARAVLPCLGERPRPRPGRWLTPNAAERDALWVPAPATDPPPDDHVVLSAYGHTYDFGPPLRGPRASE